MKFWPRNATHDQKIRYTLIHKEIVPPLPGTLDLITSYFDSIVVKVTDASYDEWQKLFFITREKPVEPQLIKTYTHRPAITHLKQGSGDSLFVIFETGTGEFLDFRSNVQKNFRISKQEDPAVSPLTVTVSHDSKKIVSGFINGKLTIYDTEKDTLETITDSDLRPFNALQFLENKRVLAARNVIRPETEGGNGADSHEILLQIWDLDLKKCVASSYQHETQRCNNLDVDRQKKSILLGMAMFDIGLQRISSFKPALEHVNVEEIYAEPEKGSAILAQQDLSLVKDPSLTQKLDFIVAYARQ